MAVSASNATAATITVPPGDIAALVAAVTTANGTPEADTLNVSGEYVFPTANNFWYGPNALPAISSDITIAGNAADGAVLRNNNGNRGRIFYVSGGRSGLSAGTLRLRNLELVNGIAAGGNSSFGGAGAGMGGAIFNQGTLSLDGVTLIGNRAKGGISGMAAGNGGGGIGQDAQAGNGGGFGSSVTANAGAGGTGGPAPGGGGGGGGPAAGDHGANGGVPAGGAGGGTPNGLGGANASGTRGGDGSGAGATGEPGQGAGGAGGAFGVGGSEAPIAPANRGGSGGGGVGAGGGGSSPGYGGGSGGFGGGGGWANFRSGSGGFGGGGAGGDGRAAGAPSGKGGFGAGDGSPVSAGMVGFGGGGAALGGAIFNDRGTVTATNSTFNANFVAGGSSTTMFFGPGVSAGEGGDGLGAAIFNLNGTLTLTHVTMAGNTATGGSGATTGAGSGTVATVGYDSATTRIATTTVRQSIVTNAGDMALYTASPPNLIDGAPNRSTVSQAATGTTFLGTADPELAPFGSYGGPTRTTPPNPGSPVINSATVQGLTATDQRGFNRDGAADLGAIETQATTVTTPDRTFDFSTSARNVTLSATLGPGRGGTSPGTLEFNAGALGTASGNISGGIASASFSLPAGAAPGTYALSAKAAAAPGFAAGTGTATIKILNPAYVCRDVTATVAYQSAVSISRDCTGAGTSTIAAGSAAHGVVTIVAGALLYTPAAGYAGSDEFTYTVTNEGGVSNTAKATVKVLSPPQVCKDVSATTAFQTAVTIATDCTGAGPVTIAAGTAAHGTVAIVAGALRYTPASGFAGTDEFTYTTTNEGGASNTAKATVKVLNAPQTCKDVTGTTAYETAITLTTDCTGADPATVTAGTAGHGSTSVVDGKLRYTPEAGFIGTDELTYTVTNEGGVSNTAKATIHVLAPPPVCKDVSVTTPYETAVDIDVDCDRAGGLTVGTDPKHGTATFREGKLRYTPDAGFSGTDELTYTTTNEGGDSNSATVTITVNPPAPTCADVAQTAGAGRGRTVTLSCVSIGASTFAIVDGPTHGKLSALDADAGTVVYTAADDYAGPDTFTYRATNAGGDSAPATATLTVTARPAVASTTSADVTLGGALTDTITVDPRFEPEAGTPVEFHLYGGDDCTGTPVFTSKAELAADGTATSEAFTPTAAGTYRWQASYAGDTGNLSATSTCDAVTVKAPPTVLQAPAAKPDAPLSVCGDPVVLLDVSPVGKRARVTGIARLEYAGQRVAIQRSGKPVGTATVNADGSFSTLVAGPAANASPPITYTAWIGDGKHSRAFRYDRFLRITKRSGLKISGKVALKRLPKKVTLVRVNVCSGQRSATTAKVAKNGSFAFTMRGPDAGSPYVLYRVSAKLAGPGKTYSTQVAVAG